MEVAGNIILAAGKKVDGVDISNLKASNLTDLTAKASELNITSNGINFSELTGSATDAQIPNTITASDYLPLAGGTMRGDINMGGTKNIINANRIAIGPVVATSYPLHIQSDGYGFMQKSSGVDYKEIGSSLNSGAQFGTWSNWDLGLVANGQVGITLQKNTEYVGIGTSNPRANIDIKNSKRISTQDADRSFNQEEVIDISDASCIENNWVTIKTINITGTKGWQAGMVEAWLTGTTTSAGNGVRFSRWYYNYDNAAPTVGVMGTDSTGGSYPANFQLAVSGDNILVQVKNGDNIAGDCYRGMVTLKFYMPRSGWNDNNFTIN